MDSGRTVGGQELVFVKGPARRAGVGGTKDMYKVAIVIPSEFALYRLVAGNPPLRREVLNAALGEGRSVLVLGACFSSLTRRSRTNRSICR